MITIKEIKMHVDLAYALLNQKTIVHFNGTEQVLPKPVTDTDIRKVKEILRDVEGELEELNHKQVARCAALAETIIG